MDHPKDVGDRSQLAVMLARRRAGFVLSVPFGENPRYALIIDDGHTIARVQCKTGRLRHGAIVWNVYSSYMHHRNPKLMQRDYQLDVDFFAVYCPQVDSAYLVPISDLPMHREASLRIEPPKNNQRRFVRYARDYEIGRSLNSFTARPGASAGAPAPSA
jgi:hypothetical protein